MKTHWQVTPAAMPHNPEGQLEKPHPTLLLTRPFAQSQGFAAEFRARFCSDWPILIAPLARLEFHNPPFDGQDIGHVIFTSQNGVAGFSRLTPDRRFHAWCVGKKTAEAARMAGFDSTIGPGTAEELADRIIAEGTVRRAFYPRARDIAFDLSKKLETGGIDTVELIVYRQERCPPMAEAAALLAGGSPILLPLFSRRSADIFRINYPEIRAPILLAAISPTVADATDRITKAACTVASHPDSDHLLDALAELLSRYDKP
ncbi:MAG: uroporphyrinogen-III synthase [Rhodobacteraceae bacterium]|nr:uroporphyrinogen-III synthase [Paracoccaceae bacterium]MCP5341444.1 uroporphyrinogen-III synthase [Paracoccaceae bacterium]